MKKKQRLEEIITDLKRRYFKGSDIDLAPQGGGYSTANNFKLDCDGNCYLLRLFPENMREQHLAKELAMTQLAANAGIAPALFYSDKHLRYALIDFVEGHTLSINELQNEGSLKAVIHQLVRLHQLPIEQALKTSSLMTQLQRFIAELNNHLQWQDFFSAQGDLQLMSCLEVEAAEPQTMVHGDLNLGNIICDKNQQLWLIDWTNAGFGSIYSDLSMLASFLPENAQQLLLVEYEKQRGIKLDRALFNDTMLLRKFLQVTWALAQAQRAAPDEVIPLSVLQNDDDDTPLLGLIDDYLEGRRPLKSKQDFLYLLSHYYQDYCQAKEERLGSVNETKPGR